MSDHFDEIAKQCEDRARYWHGSPQFRPEKDIADAFRAHYAPDVIAAKIEQALTAGVSFRALTAAMRADDSDDAEHAAWRAVLMQAIRTALE